MILISLFAIISTLLTSSLCASLRENIAMERISDKLAIKARGTSSIDNEVVQTTIADADTVSEGFLLSASFSGLNDDLISSIFEYLDYINGTNFFQISKRFNVAAKRNVLKRLVNVHPSYFVFPEFWLNHLMACELSNYYSSNHSASSISLHDKYEQSTIQMIQSKKTPDGSIPVGMHYRLKRYLHEFLYGPDSYMPVFERQWRFQFLNKMSKYDLKSTIEYYRTINEAICDLNVKDPDKNSKAKAYIQLVIEFFKGPMTQERFAHFNSEVAVLKFVPIATNVGLQDEVENLINFNFHDVLIRDAPGKLFYNFASLNYEQLFSPEMFDRLLKNDGRRLLEAINSSGGLGRNKEFTKAVNSYNFINVTNAQLKYVLSRDDLNPFDLNTYLQIRNGNDHFTFSTLLCSPDPNLTQIDIFSKLVRANIYNFSELTIEILSLVHKAYINDSPIYFDIILKESPTPVNVFFRKDANNFGSMLSITVPFKDTKLISYINSLNRNDPLPLIFIKPEKLNELREHIVGKFKLNMRRYSIDIDPRTISRMYAKFYQLETLQGQVITFKQLIDSFGIENYHTIFTTTNEESEFVTDENAPIVSLKQFIQINN